MKANLKNPKDFDKLIKIRNILKQSEEKTNVKELKGMNSTAIIMHHGLQGNSNADGMGPMDDTDENPNMLSASDQYEKEKSEGKTKLSFDDWLKRSEGVVDVLSKIKGWFGQSTTTPPPPSKGATASKGSKILGLDPWIVYTSSAVVLVVILYFVFRKK